MKARAPIILLALVGSFLVVGIIGSVNAAGCTTNCQAAFNSNVPSNDGIIWVQIYNGTGPGCATNPCTVSIPQNSPPTFNFPNGTMVSVTVLNSSFTGSSTQGHYVWKEWANYYGTINQFVWTTSQTLKFGPILYNYTGTAGFTAVFDKQYKATLSFKDAAGNSLSPAPSSLTLQPKVSGNPVTITSYSGQYVSSNNYTIASAIWEGTTVGPTSSSEIVDLTNGPATATATLKAYPAMIQIVDNNNNPVQGANVTITFVNQTSTTYTSNSKGQVDLGDIPLGPFGASVHYQGQSYGPYSLTAVNTPTNTLQVNAGSTPTSTTTAIVLLAIFGIAFFLILLAIKVRRPAEPPRI